MPQEDEPQLSSRDAATLIGCSVTTLSRAVAAGELKPAQRLLAGRYGTFLFYRSDIDRFAKDWNERTGRAS